MPSRSGAEDVSRQGRGIWFFVRRLLFGIGALFVFFAVIGAAYQIISTGRDARNYSAPGQLVDIGGYQLHLYCSGSDSGDDLTVILESGLFATTSMWTHIQDAISVHWRVCSYDRGGIGWSDPSPRPRDAANIVEELHELLQSAGIDGKLVIAGHSSGGIYARAFRARYPEHVAGLVLLDAAHEDQFSRIPRGEIILGMLKVAYSILPTAARVGLMRVTPACDLPGEFPSEARDSHGARCARVDSWKAQQLEVRALSEAMIQVKENPMLDDLPLAVVTAEKTPPREEWLAMQKELAALSSNSTHRVSPNATHVGLLLDAVSARFSSAAISDLVTSLP